MFSLNEFIMKTLRGMIGNYPDFQVREYASNWYSKGVLTEDNLAEIDVIIENQYIEPTVTESTEDEVLTDTVETDEYTEEDNETESY